MYSDQHPIFNCYQRGHQNLLETLPLYLAFLLTGGLRHPLVSAMTGAVFIISRIIYSLGYYTGDPKSRVPGAMISSVAMLILLGCSISTAAGLLDWW